MQGYLIAVSVHQIYAIKVSFLLQSDISISDASFCWMHNSHYKVNTEESYYFFIRDLKDFWQLDLNWWRCCGLWRRVKRNNLGSSNIVYTLSGRRILQRLLATDHYSGQHPPFILFTTSLHCLHPWYWRNKPAQQHLQARYTNSQHDSDNHQTK